VGQNSAFTAVNDATISTHSYVTVPHTGAAARLTFVKFAADLCAVPPHRLCSATCHGLPGFLQDIDNFGVEHAILDALVADPQALALVDEVSLNSLTQPQQLQA
jgi:hypothetical protein